MKTIAFALLAATAPGATLPGFLPLAPAAGTDAPKHLCSKDGKWCVTPPEAEDTNVYIDKGPSGPSYWSPPEGDGWDYKPLPFYTPLPAGGILLPMEASRTVGYSGGGGEFKQYVVLRVALDGTVTRVLTVPESGNLMIRACFSEADMNKRADACHDEYRLSGTLSIAGSASGMPILQLDTNAQSFPRGVSRDKDSLAGPPLKKRDLIWETDRTCTYRRTFSYDAGTRQYVPNADLPECGQYLDE